jgi:hypothetical protein
MADGSLQSHSGANLNPKTVKDRSNVPKGGEAGGVCYNEAFGRISKSNIFIFI